MPTACRTSRSVTRPLRARRAPSCNASSTVARSGPAASAAPGTGRSRRRSCRAASSSRAEPERPAAAGLRVAQRVAVQVGEPLRLVAGREQLVQVEHVARVRVLRLNRPASSRSRSPSPRLQLLPLGEECRWCCRSSCSSSGRRCRARPRPRCTPPPQRKHLAEGVLNAPAMSRVISRCCSWSLPTGTRCDR